MKTIDFFKLKSGTDCSYNHQRNQELIRRYHELTEEEQTEVMILNMGLVYRIADKLNSQNICPPSDFQEDLLCFGVIGLRKALDTYDHAKKITFSTYASICIRNEILMYLRKYSKYNGGEVSIEKAINENDQETNLHISDLLYTSTISPQDEVLNEAYYTLLQQWMEELPLEDQLILQKLYGLGDVEKTTQTELAQELGISQSYIGRRQKKIIKKLRCRFIREGVIDK